MDELAAAGISSFGGPEDSTKVASFTEEIQQATDVGAVVCGVDPGLNYYKVRRSSAGFRVRRLSAGFKVRGSSAGFRFRVKLKGSWCMTHALGPAVVTHVFTKSSGYLVGI